MGYLWVVLPPPLFLSSFVNRNSCINILLSRDVLFFRSYCGLLTSYIISKLYDELYIIILNLLTSFSNRLISIIDWFKTKNYGSFLYGSWAPNNRCRFNLPLFEFRVHCSRSDRFLRNSSWIPICMWWLGCSATFQNTFWFDRRSSAKPQMHKNRNLS